ncbi:MAG: hypothetical protein IJ841_02740 [Prevotella sp.]|nr:hypothetical protein [Prevotella sp.]
MRKTLLFSIVSLMLMLCGTIMAENKTVTFDATVDLSGQADAGAQSLSKEGITLSISNGMLGNGSEYRIYKNATLDITSTVGNITKIVFTDKGGNYKTDGFTSISAGSISETTWTGDAASLTLTAAGHQVRLTQLVVTIGEGGGEVNPEPQPTVETTGKGTLESPYTPSDAAKVATALGTTSTESYYIQGKVSEITYEFDEQHGTATFYISADGTTTDQFLVYGAYYLENKSWVEGNAQIKVGDDVIIYGKLTVYKDTPETASKQNYIYSLNGNTKNEVQPQEPVEPTETISVAKALEIINALEDGKTTAEEYEVTGYVISIDEISTSYGNATFTLADDKDAQTGVKVFRAKGFDNEKIADENIIKLGNIVKVHGKLQRYVKDEVMTPEVSSCYIVSVEEGAASVEGISMATQQGQLYNLAGQRVSVAQKGLYIRDGKKFLVK